MSDVIYVKHPVTPAQKKDLAKKGKIIDSRFAPKGAEILNADGSKYTQPKSDK